MFILVHSKPRVTSNLLRNHWGIPLSNQTYITYNITKKMTLIPSRNTLLLANTPTLRMLILIPSRTHNTSQQTHKGSCSTGTRITLVTKANLKSIQEKIISHTLWSISISKQSQLFENLKTCVSVKTQICFSEYIQRCCLLSNLNKLFIAFKDWSKH